MAYKKLIVYQKAFDLAMNIFKITKSFPVDERYSLIDQIRRSSRAVCSNIAEGYRKRKYPKHFVKKLSDSDSENAETQVWLDFALACGYVDNQTYKEFINETEEIGRLFSYMISNPNKFLEFKPTNNK